MIGLPTEDDRASRSDEGAAERLARIARAAATDADAVEAVRAALEDIIGR